MFFFSTTTANWNLYGVVVGVTADGPGVYDPCEREPTDLCAAVELQAREDVTASAQVGLIVMIILTHTCLTFTVNATASSADAEIA